MHKIAIVSPQCITPINRCTYELISLEFDLDLFVPYSLSLIGGGKKKYEEDLSENLKIIPFYLIGKFSRLYFSFDLLYKLIFKNYSYYIIDLEPSSLLGYILRLLLINKGCPIFFISNEIFSFGNVRNSIFIYMLRKFFLKQIYNQNIYIFCINNITIKIFSEIGKSSEWIPLGYKNTIFNINKYQTINKIPRIGMLGRLVFEKGAHVLIEALLKCSHLEYRLIIDNFTDYPNSPYMDKLINMIRQNNLSDRIEFISPSYEEMGNTLRSLDIVVIPSITTSSWFEQYGRIGVEALACGIPVIASDTPVLRFIYNDYATFFEECNVIQLSELLIDHINNNSFYNGDNERLKRSNYAFSKLSDRAACDLLTKKIKETI